MILWMVDSMTEWGTHALCYYIDDDDNQCCSTLPVTVYQPPHSVSISFVNHTGSMLEDRQYTLQCTVQDVAPVEDLAVTFYKGQTALGPQQSKNNVKHKTPVTEIFTLNITPSEEDGGVQYWCEAKLELGPEGPQPPPVVMSQTITATVLYKPQRNDSSHPDPIIITEGSPLQLNCTAVGNPSPSYTWLLPSDGLSTTNSSVLTISSIRTADKGRYTCSVRNAVDALTVTFNVDVRANHIGYIIFGVIAAVALVAIIVAFLSARYYKHNKMGKYNLKDVFRFHTQHSPLPSAE
ncbi:vascular cell adhesion protein 1-like isoform X2 [Chaetodon trifascialis]|uniref:vascular cell adhesion protein 1-like isoform X2 n=1 Tax=Chaetodon trifascialis TaxID=109706 RepID=UPI003992EE77